MSARNKYNKTQTKQIKIDFLNCLEKTNGEIYNTLETLSLEPSIYYKWKKEDEEFNTAVGNALKMITNLKVDEAEHHLQRNIRAGNQRAIEFLLGRLSKDKWGNVDKLEVNHEHKPLILNIVQPE